MLAIKIWMSVFAVTFIGYKFYSHRAHLKRWTLKYVLVMFLGAMISTPMVTAYNVSHPHEAIIFVAEMGFKGARLKGKFKNFNKKIYKKTPSPLKYTYKNLEKFYDKYIRPTHSHTAKTANMFGANFKEPKETMALRWFKSLKHVITLGRF